MMMTFRDQHESDMSLFDDGTGKLPSLVDDLDLINRSNSEHSQHESYYDFKQDVTGNDPVSNNGQSKSEPPLASAEFSEYEVFESIDPASDTSLQTDSVDYETSESNDFVSDAAVQVDFIEYEGMNSNGFAPEASEASEAPKAFEVSETSEAHEASEASEAPEAADSSYEYAIEFSPLEVAPEVAPLHTVVENVNEETVVADEDPFESVGFEPTYDNMQETTPRDNSNGPGKYDRKQRNRDHSKDQDPQQETSRHSHRKRNRPRSADRVDNRPVDRVDSRPADRIDSRPADRIDSRPVDRVDEQAESTSAEKPKPSKSAAKSVSHEHGIYSQGPAIGVESSLGNYVDFLQQKNPDSTINEVQIDDESYDYQVFSLDDDYVKLPRPEIFNAYPVEVQRKILEWADRDVKARRDDESRRQDAVMHARISHDGMLTTVPVVIAILGILCAAITGIITKNPVFAIVFLIIPFVIIIAFIFYGKWGAQKGNDTVKSSGSIFPKQH